MSFVGTSEISPKSRPPGIRRRAEACTEEEHYVASTAVKRCCQAGPDLEYELMFVREEK